MRGTRRGQEIHTHITLQHTQHTHNTRTTNHITVYITYKKKTEIKDKAEEKKNNIDNSEFRGITACGVVMVW